MSTSNQVLLAISMLFFSMLFTNVAQASIAGGPPPPGGGGPGPGGPGGSGSNAETVISSNLCAIVNTVQAVIGVIALCLFTLGGVLYGVAPLLPAGSPGVSVRGALQGWAMGMIVGSVVGLLIVTIAPWIISTIASTANISFTTCSL